VIRVEEKDSERVREGGGGLDRNIGVRIVNKEKGRRSLVGEGVE
jgi:hypothetical protein